MDLKKLFLWFKRFNYFRHSEAIQLIYTYRYGSLLITSVFYLASGPVSTIFYKLAVVISLYVVTRIIMDTYVKNSENASRLRLLILLETLIITLLLIPTGGMESPFIWYALNPALVAAWYLPPYFCWVNLFFYIINATCISAVVFNKGKILSLVVEYSYLIVVFILITLLVQLLALLLKRLHISNLKQRESLEDIMSLYQTIEAFSREDDIEKFFQTLTNYAAKLTKTPLAFFFINTDKFDVRNMYTNISTSDNLKIDLSLNLKKQITNAKTRAQRLELKLPESTFDAVIIKSSIKIYGVLGIQKEDCRDKAINLSERQLIFLSEISSIILDRFYQEEINDKMILLRERNRIAEEIHDSVAQRLFSINCGLHILKSKWNWLSNIEINEQINLLYYSVNEATRELRQSINSLSSKKAGDKAFFLSIKSYLKDLAKINDIKINVHLTGEEELLSTQLKKCYYRIICGATGNALKHGKSNLIDIQLNVNRQFSKLIIKDNGMGFEPEKLKREESGLGLYNMENLVYSFGGKFILHSRLNVGTRIHIEIPVNQSQKEEGDGCIDEIKVGNY